MCKFVQDLYTHDASHWVRQLMCSAENFPLTFSRKNSGKSPSSIDSITTKNGPHVCCNRALFMSRKLSCRNLQSVFIFYSRVPQCIIIIHFQFNQLSSRQTIFSYPQKLWESKEMYNSNIGPKKTLKSHWNMNREVIATVILTGSSNLHLKNYTNRQSRLQISYSLHVPTWL